MLPWPTDWLLSQASTWDNRPHKGIQLSPVHREYTGWHWITGKSNSREWYHRAEMIKQLSWQQQGQIRIRVKKKPFPEQGWCWGSKWPPLAWRRFFHPGSGAVWWAPCGHTSTPAAKMSQHIQKHHASEMLPGKGDPTRLTSAGLALDQGQLPLDQGQLPH